MKAVVLAAGRGTRLSPFTEQHAKPMMPVANRPVMEHILRQLYALGVREVYSNLYYRPYDLITYFGDGSQFGISIIWRIEDCLTGPAGGVATFADLLKDEDIVVVVSGDAFHEIDLAPLVDFHIKKRNSLLTVAMKRVTNPSQYGVGYLDEHERIIRFEEKPDLPTGTTGLVSCGIYCLGRAGLAHIPKGIEYDFGRHLIPELAAAGAPVYGFVTSAYWTDIGSPEALHKANLDAVSGRVRVALPGIERASGIYIEAGAIVEDGVILDPPVLIGAGARIGRYARIQGPVVLGARSQVGVEAYVSHSVILSDALLPERAVLVGGLLGTMETAAFELNDVE